MKLRPLVKMLIVLVTIMAFSVFAYSFPGKKGKKQEEKYGQLEITSTVKEATVFIEKDQGMTVSRKDIIVKIVPKFE